MGVTPLMTAAGVLGPGPPADAEAQSIDTIGTLLKAGISN
jgi:hypothetical protein